MRIFGTIGMAFIALLLNGTSIFAGQHGHAPTPIVNAHVTSSSSPSTAPTTWSSTKPPATAPSTSTVPLNPIASKIQSNPGLYPKVSAMLPVNSTTGKPMTLNAASMGFKNQGQFIAALHVSKNLGVPFVSLKNAMVTTQKTASGTTMTQTGSLGHAIQTVKHTSSTTASTQAATAQQQANRDIDASTTTNPVGSKSP